MLPHNGKVSQPNNEANLQVPEEQYRVMINALDLGIHMVDRDLCVLLCNPAVERSLVEFGFIRPGEPFLGRCLKDLVPFLPQNTFSEYEKVFQTGEALITEEEYHFQGEVIINEVRKVPVSSNGEVNRVLTIISNVSRRKRIEEELRGRERYLQALNQITQTALQTADIHDFLQVAADQMRDLFGASSCHMTLWDGIRHEVVPVAASGPMRDKYSTFRQEPGEPTLTQSVLKAGRALVIQDAANSIYVSPRLGAFFNVKSALGLPLISSEHRLGAALITYDGPHEFTPGEIAQAEQAAGQIALALTQAHLMENIQRQLNELTILHAVANAGAEATSADELIHRAMELLEEAFTALNFGVLLLDEDRGLLSVHPSYRAHENPELYKPLMEAAIPLGAGLIGTAAVTGQVVYAPNVDQHPNYIGLFQNTHSELCVPLRVDGRVIGVVNAERDRVNAFSPADERLLQTFTSQLATAIEKLRLFEAERKRRREAETLRETMAALVSDLDLNQVLNQILTQLRHVIPYGSASIFLQEEEGYRLVAMTGAIPQVSNVGKIFPKDDLLFAEIQSTGNALFLEDVRMDSRFHNWGNSDLIHGWMGIPIVSRGKMVGHITLDHAEAGAYRSDHAALAQVFANQAGAAIENARLFEETRQKASELAALAQVSAALRNARSRSEMLPVILGQATRVLQASGAVIASWDADRTFGTLDLGSGRWSKMTGAVYMYGEGLVGAVVASGKPFITDSAQTDPVIKRRILIGDCTHIACVPLLAESRIIGALAVGRYQPIGREQLRLLTSIADIAGNAVHRATLHEEAEQYVSDLADAYDATIEGWSRALELRDRETEGHARRVVEATIKLAYMLDIPEGEIMHIRRGVLLHDIGKMGIPDSILLKPGPLTDEEWVIMRKHPVYAYELLSPIAHLRPALDVPYCHHEKWDGTGYPRGLRGDEIPLAARIFSVIDVWEALSSTRSYRDAWPEHKVLAYIRQQSGHSFDPQVVTAFFQMLGKTST